MSDSEGSMEREPGGEVVPTADGAADEGVMVDPAPTAEASEAQAQASLEDIAETAKEFLSGLLEAMALEASVESSVEPDRAVIEVNGEDLGMLIGRRGQTLDALQEVTRTAVQRRLRSRVRLLVDVEGYRSRRRASLAEYATAMATRAKERGTEIELEPMNAYERKIVHDAVAEVEGASSFSEGEEPQRKVIVRGDVSA
jgi:spoIIIJ-associated protein